MLDDVHLFAAMKHAESFECLNKGWGLIVLLLLLAFFPRV